MPSDCGGASWADVPRAFRDTHGALPEPWQEIFGPLRQGIKDDLVVVGQFGQSIDARIATPTGHSHYINGAAGLAHLALPSPRGQLATEAILAALAERGFHHILIEGGADTVSRFLAAGCLD